MPKPHPPTILYKKRVFLKRQNKPIVLDGQKAARHLKAYIQKKHEAFIASFRKKASLGVLQIGQDPASQVYIGRKAKAAKEVGMDFASVHLDEEVSPHHVLNVLEELQAMHSGIIVQLPLPGVHAREKENYLSAISPNKDVDGLNPRYTPLYFPCTPLGCLFLLDFYDIPLEGVDCVVVGRSQLVGRPLVKLLLDRDATVTICHRQTRNLAQITQRGEILFAAAGCCHLIKRDFVNPQSIVIDVGIHRTAQGLTGDVDPEIYPHILAYSPVPGGVGPMTVSTLLWNTLQAAYRQQGVELCLKEAQEGMGKAESSSL